MRAILLAPLFEHGLLVTLRPVPKSSVMLSALSFIVSALATWAGARMLVRRDSVANAHWTERARALSAERRLLPALALCMPILASWTTTLAHSHWQYLNCLWSALGVWAGARGGGIQPRPLPAFRAILAMLLLQMPQLLMLAAWVGLSAVGLAPPERILVFLMLTALILSKGAALGAAKALGLVRSASPGLSERVAAISEQAGIDAPEVIVVPYRHANAFAWVRWNTIGLTELVLERLSLEEQVAVLSHELGHMAEPRWARRVRWAMNGYFPLLLATSAFVSTTEARMPWLLGVVLVSAPVARLLKGFSHRMENAADAFACALAGEAYGRALERIYEINLMPVVMGGKSSSHPDLYDRLCGLGAKPAYERPEPPFEQPFKAAFRVAAVVAVIGFGAPLYLLMRQNPARMGREPAGATSFRSSHAPRGSSAASSRPERTR